MAKVAAVCMLFACSGWLVLVSSCAGRVFSLTLCTNRKTSTSGNSEIGEKNRRMSGFHR